MSAPRFTNVGGGTAHEARYAPAGGDLLAELVRASSLGVKVPGALLEAVATSGRKAPARPRKATATPAPRKAEAPAQPPAAGSPAEAPAQVVQRAASGTMDLSGRLVVRFARIAAVDAHGDVHVHGCIGAGSKEVPLGGWNHGSWKENAPPIGVGRVAEEAGYLVFRGRLLLETEAAKAVYAYLKAAPGISEWSYGLRIVKWHHGRLNDQPVRFLDQVIVDEVSPVLRAASFDSALVELHGLDPAGVKLAAEAAEKQRVIAQLQATLARTAPGAAPADRQVRVLKAGPG
jgi:hypothetical protein